MKSLKLRKLVAAAVAALTIAAISPVGASAEWRQDSTGWWNTEGDSYSIGWRYIDGDWYYFDSTGYMETGWANDGGTWYYMQPSGAMKTGWVKDNGTWYYLQASGAMKTGWVYDNAWYYLQPSGAMKTGWIYDNGTWYFADASGAMQTGIIEVDGKVYYLAPSGAMQTGSVVINGVTYTFAASGEAIGDKIPTPTLRFTSAGVLISSNGQDKDSSSSSSGGSSSGGSGGSSSGTTDAQQRIINNVFKSDAKAPTIQVLAKDPVTGEATIKPTVSFTPGTTATTTLNGVTYTVKKDISVNLNDGTDVGVSGDYATGYKIEKGKSGTVTATISLLGSDGSLRYVDAQSTNFSNQ